MTEAVVHRTVVSFAILTPRPITELAAPSTDIAETLTRTVEQDARADVMAQPVVLGVPPERPLQLQRRLEPKSPFWDRLRVRPRMAFQLLTVHVVLEMGTPFVVIGQTVLAVLFMG